MKSIDNNRALTRIDLNLLVVFDVIYREANLTRAADRLHLTQPAVSNALSRLRQSFDDPLFVRSGRTMRPTPLAHDMAPGIQEALSRIETVCTREEGFDPSRSDRTFRLAMNDISGTRLMPVLIERLAREAPGIRLENYQLSRNEIRQELASGKTDFAIDTGLPTYPDIRRTAFNLDSYACAMRKDHPLARRSLTFKRFMAAGHLTVSNRRSGLSFIEDALRRIDVRLEPAARLQNYTTALNTVKSTDLLVAVPVSLIDSPELVIKPLPFETPPLQSWLYWHESVENDKASLWMRTLLGDIAPALIPDHG